MSVTAIASKPWSTALISTLATPTSSALTLPVMVSEHSQRVQAAFNVPVGQTLEQSVNIQMDYICGYMYVTTIDTRKYSQLVILSNIYLDI